MIRLDARRRDIIGNKLISTDGNPATHNPGP
jgi:hypothetical protein